MTITWANLEPKLHTWFVWESEPYRLQRSASDLNGTDPNLHSGTPEGVLKELRNAFQRDRAPTVQSMLDMYRFIRNSFGAILSRNGTNNPYERSVFIELRWASSELANLLGMTRRTQP